MVLPDIPAAADDTVRDILARRAGDPHVQQAVAAMRTLVQRCLDSFPAHRLYLAVDAEDIVFVSQVLSLHRHRDALQSTRRSARTLQESQTVSALLQIVAEAEHLLGTITGLVVDRPQTDHASPPVAHLQTKRVRGLHDVAEQDFALPTERQRAIDRELGFLTFGNNGVVLRCGSLHAWGVELGISDITLQKRVTVQPSFEDRDTKYYVEGDVSRSCVDLLHAALPAAGQRGGFNILHESSSEIYLPLARWAAELGIEERLLRMWVGARRGLTARKRGGQILQHGFYAASVIRACCRGHIPDERLAQLR